MKFNERKEVREKWQTISIILITFYRQQHRGGGRYEGTLMRAMDKDGSTHWGNLTPDAQTALTETARGVFAAPYHSRTTETPGGSSNVKNVYEVSSFYPEGHLNVGMWWDRHMDPETYYKKIGYYIEIAGIGEDGRNQVERRR